MTEVLDLLAYPTGTILRINFRKFELGDPDTLAVTSPKRFLVRLSRLYDGDKRCAEALILLTAHALAERLEVYVEPEDLLEAFRNGRVERIIKWLENIGSLVGGSDE